MPIFSPTAIRSQVTSVLKGMCGGVTSTLRHSTKTIVNHVVTGTTPTDYDVYAVSDSIQTVEIPGDKPGSRELKTSQMVYVSADNIPDDVNTQLATSWVYIDAQGVQYGLYKVEPVKPVNGIAILYELEMVR